MKKILLALSLSVALPAVAEESDTCTMVSRLASTIMESRQIGVPLSELIADTSDSKLTRRLIMDAYESPRYNSKKMRQRSIVDFGSEWMLLCLKYKK